jgi:hypothetical protein
MNLGLAVLLALLALGMATPAATIGSGGPPQAPAPATVTPTPVDIGSGGPPQ